MIGLMSRPGIQPAATRATRETWLRSLISALPAPGYCTLTATSRPSCHTARCTWPIEAAAAGVSSKDGTGAASGGPARRASTLCTAEDGIGGAESCSRVSVARYGPASSSGIAASKIDIACPNFMAPPLSSPRTLKSCSAVRACTSAATSSAGLPPTRLPMPRAVRPAKPSGSDASLTERVTALRGSSLTGPLLPASPRIRTADGRSSVAAPPGARAATPPGRRRAGPPARPGPCARPSRRAPRRSPSAWSRG